MNTALDFCSAAREAVQSLMDKGGEYSVEGVKTVASQEKLDDLTEQFKHVVVINGFVLIIVPGRPGEEMRSTKALRRATGEHILRSCQVTL